MTTIRFAALLFCFIAMMPVGEDAPAAGPPDPEVSYIFASPNTQSQPAGHGAPINLKSFEELHAIALADRITCSFTHAAAISSTLGVFNGETEVSFVVETELSAQKIAYAAALLGKLEHQEFVLWFTPQIHGRDRLWTIRIPRRNTPYDSKSVIAAMRQLHIASATIRTTAASTELWIADFASSLKSAPEALAATLKGEATWQPGTAQLFGNSDRAKASTLFQAKIAAFERLTNARLSARMESLAWRNVTTRTCSSEVRN